MILSFSHNDLDALGCELCISNKFRNTNINYVNTNYRNIEEKTNEVLNLIPKATGLFITDICFNEHIKLLEKIKNKADSYNVPIFYIDHHEYDDIKKFSDLNFKYFIVDKTKCASVLTAEFLKVPEKLMELCLNIQSFDIWQDENPRFKEGLKLNAYYWNKFLSNGFKPSLIHNYFYPDFYSDYETITTNYFKEALEYLEANKHLIIKKDKITYALIDEHYITLQLKEFKTDTEVILIFTTYNKLMIRVRKDLINKADKIKMLFTDDNRGHKLAFSFDKEFKSIKEIQNYIEDLHPKLVSILNS